MRRLPPLQLAREMAEFVMIMNANGTSFYNRTLDELAALHRKMKQESECSSQERAAEDIVCFSESFPLEERELVTSRA